MAHFGVTQRSDRLINYFLGGYFFLGLFFASFYHTWLIAVIVGTLSLSAYYAVKFVWPNTCHYQYVLGAILGIFTAQFIYQLHGMFEMHFFVFIGSALLITYQNWKLQLPLLLFIVLHHVLFSCLQDMGISQVYFSQLSYRDLPTFATHILLTGVICFICGLCAFQLHQYHQLQLLQAAQLAILQEAANEAKANRKDAEAMKERNTILESIGDAFFAVDKEWVVTYWNRTAEEVLFKTKQEMVGRNLWEVFDNAVGSESYRQYYRAVQANCHVHFEDYFEPLDKWYEVSAYPSAVGLSVYFKDITERKQHQAVLRESKQRYSDVFHFSPLPMWVVNLESLVFIDVNEAMTDCYGYTRAELLTMTLRDIRPENELIVLQRALDQGDSEPGTAVRRQMIHRKKNGDLMNMDLQIAPFLFKGIKTSIVIATDVTERLQYVKAVEEQNKKLLAISWMQSHVVRAPLARIMGLIPMFTDPQTTIAEKREISTYLVQSADEMDAVIRDIIDATVTATIK